MPQPATHYWVVRRAIPKYDITGEINYWEEWWDKYKAYFGLGTAAPDLFYFPLMPNVTTTFSDFYWDGIADLLHHAGSYDVFCELLNCAKNMKNTSPNESNKLFAFAFGYYCHVITDCIFHPYVYRSTGDHWANKVVNKIGDMAEYKNELKHKYQEFCIDRGIYNEFNLGKSTSLDRVAWKCSNAGDDRMEPTLSNCFYNALMKIYPDCFPPQYNDPNDINHPIQQAYAALAQTIDILFRGSEVFLFGGKIRIPSSKIQEHLIAIKEEFFIEPYPNSGSLTPYTPQDLFNFSCGVARKIFIESLKYWEDSVSSDSKEFFEANYTNYLNQGNWNLDTGLKCNLNNLAQLHGDNGEIDKASVEELNGNYIVFRDVYNELFIV